MQRFRIPAFILIGLCWLGFTAWQVMEHRRVADTIHEAQLAHAHDVATSLAVVIRSQRRFGAVSERRLTDALQELAKGKELHGIALLNPNAEIVASGGAVIPEGISGLAPGNDLRQNGNLFVAALVELGPEKHPRPHRGPERDMQWTKEDEEKAAAAVIWDPDGIMEQAKAEEDSAVAAQITPQETGEKGDKDKRKKEHRKRWERMRQSHPFWQSPEKYRERYEKQGLHMMILVLDDTLSGETRQRDAMTRIVLCAIALGAALGLVIAWISASRSDQLLIRLARARASNTYLRELNLAAAGLAHETRNPLNLVRGHTQVVADDPDLPEASKDRLELAVQEVDRITARLNEFIDYSRPRKPELNPVALLDLIADVQRTLETDLEDNQITFNLQGDSPQVEADSGMLRQVLFNLILNATQAMDQGGTISIKLEAADGQTTVSIIDDGPGIPDDKREEIFKPYVSLSQTGSGLGLSVARQIAIAHQWDLTCPETEHGATFVLTGLTHST